MQKFTFFFQSRRNSDFSEESTQLSLYSRKLGTKIFDENVKLYYGFVRQKYKLGPINLKLFKYFSFVKRIRIFVYTYSFYSRLGFMLFDNSDSHIYD